MLIDNAVNSKAEIACFEALGGKLILVSSAFHMARLMKLAEARDISALPAPAGYVGRNPLFWIPSADALNNFRIVVYECLGRTGGSQAIILLFQVGCARYVYRGTDMLIDIHTHATECMGLTRYNGSRYPTLAELIDMLDERGIDKAVLLCSVSPEVRYVLVTPYEVLTMATKHPDRIIPFCSVDPRMMTNSIKRISGLCSVISDRGCKGIGDPYSTSTLIIPSI